MNRPRHVITCGLVFLMAVAASSVGVRAAAQGRGEPGGEGRGGRGGGGGLPAKNPDLPAGAFTPSSTLAHTPLKHEWVDIPLGGRSVHTCISYPEGTPQAPLGLL